MTRIRESNRFHDRRSPHDRIVHLIDAMSYDEVIASNSGPNSSRNIWRKTNERTSSPSPSILSTIDRSRRIVAHDAWDPAIITPFRVIFKIQGITLIVYSKILDEIGNFEWKNIPGCWIS